MSPTALKILGPFISDPRATHHEREVLKLTGVSKGSANAYLRLLAEEKILLREDRGRMAFYRLNLRNPLARQIKILHTVEAMRGTVDKLSGFSRKVILYGSCAEGTDASGSDTDLFVISDQREDVEAIIREKNAEVGRRISALIVDPVELLAFQEREKYLYENIVKGITLWARDE